MSCAIPPQAIGLRADVDLIAERIRVGLEHADLAGTTGGAEEEGAIPLGAQDTTALGAAGQGALMRLTLAVNYLERVVCGVRHENASRGQVDVTMVEAAVRV